jgi:hypothetical protein
MKGALSIAAALSVSIIFGQSDTPCSGSGAPIIPVNTTCVNSTVQITTSDSYQFNAANFGPVSCGSSGQDVWYAFVAPAVGSVNILTSSGSITDAVMALYESDCVSYTELDCNDDGGPGLMPEISMAGLNPGQTYYIRFWDYGGGTGSFNVCVVEGSATAVNQDCSGATGVCNNASFSGNSNGAGSQELNITNSGCLYIEHQSSWYVFQAQTTGTLTFTLSPQNGTDDYDFAIWGPGAVCPPTGPPIRCSYAAGGGDTGLQNGAGDNTESAFGDRWVEDMTIIAGQTYIMLIDNWSATTSPFTFSWGGTASLDCTVLPVEFIYFGGACSDGLNVLNWITATETDNDHFVVQRSHDGLEFYDIGTVEGIGNSVQNTAYSFADPLFSNCLNYYRLRQIDLNGTATTSRTVVIDNSHTLRGAPLMYLNGLGQQVEAGYQGIHYAVYNSGARLIMPQK